MPQSAAINRVRCVIVFEQHYLLAQHRTRRPESIGKWGLLGGRLKAPEDPRAGLRREVFEELRVHLPYVVELGDWPRRDEIHRVFGCHIGQRVEWFERDEIVAIDWFRYDEVVQLAASGQLQTGFELAAITAFRSQAAAGPASIKLSRRPSKKVRGDRKARGPKHGAEPTDR